MDEPKKCSVCGCDITEENKCSCDETKCAKDCECGEGCDCGCKEKQQEEKEEE